MIKYFICFFLTSLSLSAAEETPLPKELQERYERSQIEGDTKFYESFIQMLFYLGVMIVVLYVGMHIIKNMLYKKPTQSLEKNDTMSILEAFSLSPKTTLYIIEVEGKKLLIAESMQSTSLLRELSHTPFKEVYENHSD